MKSHRQILEEKLAFLLREEAITSDPLRKFELKQRISELQNQLNAMPKPKNTNDGQSQENKQKSLLGFLKSLSKKDIINGVVAGIITTIIISCFIIFYETIVIYFDKDSPIHEEVSLKFDKNSWEAKFEEDSNNCYCSDGEIEIIASYEKDITGISICKHKDTPVLNMDYFTLLK